MLEIRPIARALVPVDSDAAQAISGPNYDEFQSDGEIWQLLQKRPDNILTVTMPHCAVASADDFLVEGSDEALEHARGNLKTLIDSPSTRTVENIMAVYEIRGRKGRQVGLVANATTAQIRTEDNPGGTIVRNEGIRKPKAEGRARLIERTSSIIGAVNNAVKDAGGAIAKALDAVVESRSCDYLARDETDNTHSIWLIEDAGTQARFVELLAAEPEAFVADGNHRSAAAASLGYEGFLAVFFVMDGMAIDPYNRLVDSDLSMAEILDGAKAAFDITPVAADDAIGGFQPGETHHIGLYGDGRWHLLRPRPDTFDPADAAQSIDADIVQRHLFAKVLGYDDPRHARLNFVGGNKDAAYLMAQVDDGRYRFALTLPPVTLEQFAEVCRQNRFMPPKSTWFDPKVRSGLVVSLVAAHE